MKRVNSIGRLVVAAACLLFLPTRSAVSQTWTELSTVGGPSGVDFHGFAGRTVAYDPVANRLIVFLSRNKPPVCSSATPIRSVLCSGLENARFGTRSQGGRR
jgi:hypothetical protein